MNRLLDIGFRAVGCWKLKDGEPVCQLDSLVAAKNVLYAFISDGEVKYVGKTTQTLGKRMYFYQNPGPRQSTNIKVKQQIKELLSAGRAVDILALADNGLIHYGNFHLNLAAGLEDSIISKISPEWNGRGIQHDTTKETTSESETAPQKTGAHRANLDVEPLSRKPSKIFKLKLGKTYYQTGFFNMSVNFDRYIGPDKAVIEILTYDGDQPIHGYINRTANNNGTARIMGGVRLRDWFKKHFEIGDTVNVEILSPTCIKLYKGQT